MFVLIMADEAQTLNIHFSYNPEIHNAIQKVAGIAWDQETLTWHIPDTQEHLDQFLDALLETGLFTYSDTEDFRLPSVDLILDNCRMLLQADPEATKTKKMYILWIERFIAFHNQKNPLLMKEPEIYAFIKYLADELTMEYSSLHNAEMALVFLYKQVLSQQVKLDFTLIKAKKVNNLPCVMTRLEVEGILSQLKDKYWVIIFLIYKTGIRIKECLQLRLRDLDLTHQIIIIRRKDDTVDRKITIPVALQEKLTTYLSWVKMKYCKDIRDGWGSVALPSFMSMANKKVCYDWEWQWVFPQDRRHEDKITKNQSRAHISSTKVEKALRDASLLEGMQKIITYQSLRNSFVSHSLENALEIVKIENSSVQYSMKTIMPYVPVLKNKELVKKTSLDAVPV